MWWCGGMFTDLSWLHISGIIIRASATGTAAHLVIVILTQSQTSSLLSLTIRNPEAHSWSKACSRELCFRKYLEVYLSPSRPRSGSRLSFRVSCRHLVRQSYILNLSYLEDLPAESWLPTDQDPSQLPEARGGHVSSADGECASVAHSDVALRTEESYKYTI